MFASINSTINYCLTYYADFFRYHWHHMTPDKYAAVLIAVLILGWYMMRSDIKHPGS